MTSRDVIKKVFTDLESSYIQVCDVFKEYFGEDRVDIQDVPTLEEAIIIVENSHLGQGFLDLTNYPLLTKYFMTHDNPKVSDIDWSKLSTPEAQKEFYKFVFRVLTQGSNAPLIRIYVLWPSVTIENEHGRTHNITELYARIMLRLDGVLYNTFRLTRGTYTEKEFNTNYMHSHVSGLAYNSNNVWTHNVCVGSGPIGNTMNILKVHFDIDRWRLFCFELDNFVAVESIAGGPYNRMENLSNNQYAPGNFGTVFKFSPAPNINNILLTLIEESFVKFYIQNPYSVNYIIKMYEIGVDLVDITIKFSNYLIKCINAYNKLNPSRRIVLNDLLQENILYRGFVINGKIKKEAGSNGRSWLRNIGNPLFRFKGEMVKLKLDSSLGETTGSLLLSENIINYLIGALIIFTNFTYLEDDRNEYNREEIPS